MKSAMLTLAIAIAALSATGASARDQMQISGSSTMLPYATILAAAFGENFDFPTSVVDGSGSGAGRQKLCDGVGENTTDIANSALRIKQSDIDNCALNGVNAVMDMRFGYDGIAFASEIDGPEFAFTPADWYNAIAANVVQDGKLVENTNKTWADVNAALPAQNILTFIPGTKHSTREVFDVKDVEAGCEESGAAEAFKAAGLDEGKECVALRTDGASVDIDGDDTKTLAHLAAYKNAIGVFGLSFRENNTDKLRVATMSGVLPSTQTVAPGAYPVSRPLFFSVKTAHFGVTFIFYAPRPKHAWLLHVA